MVYIKYDFEFNLLKSEKNRIKHGIDFVQAQELWLGPYVRLETSNLNEIREVIVGKLGSNFWSAVITYRGKKIRIISVRRSREKEKNFYFIGANNS